MHSFVSFYDFSIFAQQPVQIDFFSLCRIFGCGGRVLHKVPLLSDSKQLKFVLGGEAPRAPFLLAFPSFSQSNFRRTTQAMKKSAVFAAFAIKGSSGLNFNYDSPPLEQVNVNDPQNPPPLDNARNDIEYMDNSKYETPKKSLRVLPTIPLLGEEEGEVETPAQQKERLGSGKELFPEP